MSLPSPFGLGWKLFAWCFGRLSRKGLFSCADREAAGRTLLGERLVKIAVGFLEGRCIKAVADDVGVSEALVTRA